MFVLDSALISVSVGVQQNLCNVIILTALQSFCLFVCIISFIKLMLCLVFHNLCVFS